MSEQHNLEQAIAALERQRQTLGDAVVDAALKPLREKLAQLESEALSGQQRKQATVLLADISGFTAMSERMDAEVVGDLMNALWRRIDAVIVEYGGMIDKHIGDAVMALWGVDQAREDDPERAIRAALEMQDALGAFRDEHHLSTQLRVGINTGLVLLGDVGTTGEFSAIGDVVNLTQRLEEAAPPGGILISHDTYRHVRGIFDVESREPMTVKGKNRPVQTYVVLRPKPRAFRVRTRGVEGVETRMIGRAAELEALQETFNLVVAGGQTRVVTVVGEAGVGKSRLLYEFDNWIELLPREILYFKGKAIPATERIPYSIIRDMFAYRFQILESDSAAAVLEKFRAGMDGVLESDQADLVGHLIGFDFSQGGSQTVRSLLGSASFRQMATAYLVTYVRRMADQPTVIFLEDVHWADDSSLDLVQHLVREVPDAQLMVVCLARPPFLERRPDWGRQNAAYTRLDLGPLSNESSLELVDEILQRVDQVPDPLRQLVVDGAEGNPFYVEELIKMLIEDGVIERSDRVWRTNLDQLTRVRVPQTLTGVLQARLDSLPDEEKAILQRASVVGRLFWDAAVTELVVDGASLDNTRVNTVLDVIRRRELVFQRDQSAFEGTQEYVFKHAILRDVTYETVLLKLRRIYHQQVAEWLEDNAGERVREYLGLIANHYELAGQRLKAAEYRRRLGLEYVNVGVYGDALTAFDQALAQLTDELRSSSEGAELELALFINIGAAYRLLGNYVKAREYLDDAMSLAVAQEDTVQQAFIIYNFSDMAYRQGSGAEARRYAQQSLEMCIETDNQLGIANAYRALGFAAFSEKDYAAAREYTQKSLAVYEELDRPRGVAACLINLGEAARKEGRYEEAARHYEDALSINRKDGNRFGAAVCLNNLGNVYAQMGQADLAWRYLREALEEMLDIGGTPVVMESLSGVALVFIHRGEVRRAAELLGIVLAHPLLNEEIRSYVDPVIDRLRGALPAEELDALLASGREVEIKDVIEELLAEKGDE